jgi:hypothetical protein
MSPIAGALLVDEIIPRLQNSIPMSVSRFGCEDIEELIQDGTVMAAQILISAESKGKNVSAGNVVFYTIHLLQSGRRSTGSSKTDVLSIGTQMCKRSSLEYIDAESDPSSDDASAGPTLSELLCLDKGDPAFVIMRKLDWECFAASLDARLLAFLEWIAQGKELSRLAALWKTTPCVIAKVRKELAVKLQEFFGSNLWTMLTDEPAWKDGLVAARERMACRCDRRSVAASALA